MLRLDGAAPPRERAALIAAFNDPKGAARVFLLSTRAGSVGINLVAATRLVLFDVPWNPVHNAQVGDGVL